MVIAPKARPASKASGGVAHGVRQKISPMANRIFEFIELGNGNQRCVDRHPGGDGTKIEQ